MHGPRHNKCLFCRLYFSWSRERAIKSTRIAMFRIYQRIFQIVSLFSLYIYRCCASCCCFRRFVFFCSCKLGNYYANKRVTVTALCGIYRFEFCFWSNNTCFINTHRNTTTNNNKKSGKNSKYQIVIIYVIIAITRLKCSSRTWKWIPNVENEI